MLGSIRPAPMPCSMLPSCPPPQATACMRARRFGFEVLSMSLHYLLLGLDECRGRRDCAVMCRACGLPSPLSSENHDGDAASDGVGENADGDLAAAAEIDRL